jgi:hypothetical protein
MEKLKIEKRPPRDASLFSIFNFQFSIRATRARSSVVEQLAFNQLVVGSIPTGLTILKKIENGEIEN